MIVDVMVRDDKHEQPFTGQDVWKADNVQLAFQLPGQSSCWELGLSLLADGTAQACCWAAPKGQDAARACKQITLQTSRDDSAKITRYHAVIPATAIGLAADAQIPIPFNLFVNDSDAGTRESFIAIAPGFGFGKHETALFPLISF
ncbi:hypothetical protein [Oligosphaera ethanolica]|uniref:Carbohydrate-binding domain-containing protein n=1 Tax=Oligosphaera ethanolica TaxID=760260 RepID=A0AAE3VEM4_9BACT|nr:hypothetical protein [Oligosphaera ethanolica]MDQ0289067.1 hypothetical protein [Oligosphaera ethanolica]